ncbi:hypothetical protein FSP39_013723 [Pinctada imbricata]|uniref:G-protein coupled receptors family 1 profile domain-containing protein n=1 Tax=Pinctada imbricata TaxID=66713 RepID=A0AA89BWD2_PINIB|nr:hypothetical protein FSP39_013723 [Pinctada imbricata]
MCHPFGPYFTRGKQRLAMMLSILVSLIYSIPPAFIYGSVPFQNPHGNITGYRCSIVKSGYKRLAYAYGISLAVLAVVIVTSLVIMYSRIGFAVRSHLKRISKFRSLTSLNSSVQSLHHVNGNKRVAKDTDQLHVENNQKLELKSKETEMTQSNKRTTESAIESSQNLVKPHAHVNVPQDAEDRELMLKFTIMFVLITVVFFVCFATKGTIMVIEALDPYFWENIDSVTRAIMILMYNLYIFSYVINPIIFAAFDGQFKYELKRLRSRLCRK